MISSKLWSYYDPLPTVTRIRICVPHRNTHGPQNFQPSLLILSTPLKDNIIYSFLFIDLVMYVFYFLLHHLKIATSEIFAFVFHYGKYFVLNSSLGKILERHFLSFK